MMMALNKIQKLPILAGLFSCLSIIHNERSFVHAFVVRCQVQPTATPRTILGADTAAAYGDDGDEYEYVEYERLTESEFVMSEWLVGTNWDSSRSKIDETWVRLIVDDDGKNVAYWGDKSEGKWSLDVATQFLSISKENLYGKQIWAGVVDDFYYLQGTVRGWTYWQAAAVLGQWQAKRLGVDKEEAGTPPWFENDEE
ncbi:hypothetical protein ACA910_008517 [Epithemia clementina (nom. ined.)]